MDKFDVKKIDTLKGHKDSVFALDFHKVDNLIFSASSDGMVVLWDISQKNFGKIIARVPASVYAIKYISNKNHLLIAQNFDGLHLIDLETNKEKTSVQLSKSYLFDIQYNNQYIIVAEGQGRLFLLERETLKVLHVWDETDKSARSISLLDNIAAVGYSDNTIRLFDIDKRKKIDEWTAHENSVFKVLFSEDGTLMSSSRDAHLKFWKIDGQLEEDIIAHMYAINDICLSPDLNYLATCSMDKTIKIWDYKNKKLLKVIDKARHAGHGTSVNKLLWTNFNNYIVSCSDDRSLSIWEINKSIK
ncbi:WD40 repeat domain-containing protein [Hyphobacterium sp. CCMP332]|nr:WD40 repeat domain-containing protein [Hyphobacterium sp. CCMP332]